MGLHLEDLASLVGDDGEEINSDILGHHVLDESEGNGVLLAGGDRDVVLGGREVANDGSRLRSALGQRLGGLDDTADNGDLNWAILVVGDLNQSLGDATVDELDSKDVGLGESGLDIGLELSRKGTLRRLRSSL